MKNYSHRGIRQSSILHHNQSPWPPCSPDFFFWGGKRLFIVRKCKRWITCTTEFPELRCLPILGDKLSILTYIVPLMVPGLSSTDHVWNFVRSSIWKCINLSNTFYNWRYVLFYCHLRPNTCIRLDKNEQNEESHIPCHIYN